MQCRKVSSTASSEPVPQYYKILYNIHIDIMSNLPISTPSQLLFQYFMFLVPLRPDLNLHTLQHPSLNSLIADIHPIERPVRDLEFDMTHRPPDLEDLIWRQRDRVGD